MIRSHYRWSALSIPPDEGVRHYSFPLQLQHRIIGIDSDAGCIPDFVSVCSHEKQGNGFNELAPSLFILNIGS